MQYRERFGYTHQDIREMDLQDLLTDLTMLKLESEAQKKDE